MSDLAATGCGCGGSPISGSGNCSCNVLLWILILSCACGGEGGIFGNSLFGGNGCGDAATTVYLATTAADVDAAETTGSGSLSL